MFKGVDAKTQIVQKQPINIEKPYNEYKAGTRTSPFPVLFLRAVEARPVVNSKSFTLNEDVVLAPNSKPTVEQVTPDSLRWLLDFKFENKDGSELHTESIWDIPADDPKYDNKSDMAVRKFGQIFEAFVGAGSAQNYLTTEKIFGKNKQNWENYFKGIANIFNTSGENGTPVYTNKPVRVKLIRNRMNKQNPNELQAALGNFIEPYIKDNNNSILQIRSGDEFHIIEKPKAAAFGAAPAPGGGFGGASSSNNDDWGDTDL